MTRTVPAVVEVAPARTCQPACLLHVKIMDTDRRVFERAN
jgi:hypothetical protein